MLKSMMIAAALTLAGSANAGPLAPPTAFQVYPYLATVCMNDAPASTAYVTGTDSAGNLVGEATVQGFVCRLRVHSGRGPGIRIVSACADVVWTPDGATIYQVLPVSAAFGAYSIQCN